MSLSVGSVLRVSSPAAQSRLTLAPIFAARETLSVVPISAPSGSHPSLSQETSATMEKVPRRSIQKKKLLTYPSRQTQLSANSIAKTSWRHKHRPRHRGVDDVGCRDEGDDVGEEQRQEQDEEQEHARGRGVERADDRQAAARPRPARWVAARAVRVARVVRLEHERRRAVAMRRRRAEGVGARAQAAPARGLTSRARGGGVVENAPAVRAADGGAEVSSAAPPSSGTTRTTSVSGSSISGDPTARRGSHRAAPNATAPKARSDATATGFFRARLLARSPDPSPRACDRPRARVRRLRRASEGSSGAAPKKRLVSVRV